MNQTQNDDTHQPQLPAVPPAGELEQKLAEAEKKSDEYLAGWQRAKADFQNYQKDEARRLEELARYANEAFLGDLVAVLDNVDLAIASLERAGPVERGIYLIRSQIEDALRRNGLSRIRVKPGDAFDPNFMESVAETAGAGPPGTVADEVEAGYRLHDKVIRPARVRLVREDERHTTKNHA